VAVDYNREQICLALTLTDPAISSYLDLQTGNVVQIDETDDSPETEQLREAVMAAYGDRYRYISGGNSTANDSAVTAWMEAEGL
jgi:hypothetical protein